jgi:hypothetical protein
MKILKLFVVILFVGLSMSIEAQTVDNNDSVFSNFTALSNRGDVSISSTMIEKGKIFIQWKSEMQGVYFEIEHSIDGENYKTIATPEDVVKTSKGTTFLFIDEAPEIENYYRVFFITPSSNVDYSEATFASPLPMELTIGGGLK